MIHALKLTFTKDGPFTLTTDNFHEARVASLGHKTLSALQGLVELICGMEGGQSSFIDEDICKSDEWKAALAVIKKSKQGLGEMSMPRDKEK